MNEKAASVREPRERLELRLREMLDDDDAVSVVQIMLAEGWTPPPASGPPPPKGATMNQTPDPLPITDPPLEPEPDTTEDDDDEADE